MFCSQRRSRLGFTFIEIMFVVVIIGILLALVGPRLAGKTQKARITTTGAQLRNIEQAIKNFEVDIGTFPKNLNELLEGNSEYEKSWDGPYIDGDVVPKDAWNAEFNFKNPGEKNKKGYDLWSNGPDKKQSTEDDIGNWTKKS